ncbi:MAG: esterase [Burkholderiales bacterium]|nr:esterase [Burkholderiales bacterium]
MTTCDLGPRPHRRALGLLLRACVLAAAALLTSCGGGTTPYNAFVALRLFTFGDEASTLNADGSNYSVNGLGADGNISCSVLPIWTQTLASNFGLVFAQCNPDFVVDPQATSWAAPGAHVADVAAQIDAQVAAGGFRDQDLTTVFVGTNDILDLYAQYPLRSEADLTAEATSLGLQAAQQVNRLVAFGAKVIVVNLPDLGLTPFAINENLFNSDTDRAALISRLTAAFNQELGVSIVLDGRYVGLVQLDQRSQVIARAAAAYSFTDVVDAVCTVALPGCTTSTLVPGGSATTYLWASDRWLSAGGQSQIAGLAIDRARGNPF